MAERASFIVYYEWFDYLDMLSPESAYKILHSVRDYLKDGKESEKFTEPAEQMAYSLIMRQVIRDTKKYLETCEKRSEAGRRGGRPVKHDSSDAKAKKANAFSEKQVKAKKADNEYELDNVNEYENGIDYVSGKACGKVEKRFICDTIQYFLKRYQETFHEEHAKIPEERIDLLNKQLGGIEKKIVDIYFDRPFYPKGRTNNALIYHFSNDKVLGLCKTAVKENEERKSCEEPKSTVGVGPYLP